MTWSYSGNPNNSDKDAVRFCIGDTDPDECLLQDEEIDYLLSVHTTVSQASQAALDKLCAKFARCADETVGRVSVKWSQRYEHYKKLRDTIADDPSSQCPMPFAGGIDCGDRAKFKGDVEPIFKRHMDENLDANESPSFRDECEKC